MREDRVEGNGGRAMRMLLVGIFLVLFAIVSIPLYFVAWLLGKKDEKLQVAFSQKIVKAGFRIIFFIAGVKIDCRGVERVPKDEPIMYIGNHFYRFTFLATHNLHASQGY